MSATETAEADGEAEEDTIGERWLTVLGIGSGLVALNMVPLAFGGFSIYCGYRIYQYHHAKNGIAVMILGMVCLIEGLVFG